MKREARRQIIHFVAGLAVIAFLMYFGRGFAIAGTFGVIIGGTVIINLRLRGIRIPVITWIEERFERRNVLFIGWGSACYVAGILIPLTFLTDVNQIAAAIFILAIGDGFSTIIGRMGKIRLPHNRKKTLEGSVAFLLSSLPAYYFVGPVIVPVALLATVIESISSPIDDNLTVPIACTIFFLVI